jgi:hypothetical protein
MPHWFETMEECHCLLPYEKGERGLVFEYCGLAYGRFILLIKTVIAN